MVRYIIIAIAFVISMAPLFAKYKKAVNKRDADPIRKGIFELIKSYGLKYTDGYYLGRTRFKELVPLEDYGAKGKLDEYSFKFLHSIPATNPPDPNFYVSFEMELKNSIDREICFAAKYNELDSFGMYAFISEYDEHEFTEEKNDMRFKPASNVSPTESLIKYCTDLPNGSLCGLIIKKRHVTFIVKLPSTLTEPEATSLFNFAVELRDYINTDIM